MPFSTTFGCEAEYEVNASNVIARLHEMGVAKYPTLHDYHCSCDGCEFRNGWAFRGQTDSSCSGEIITDVLGMPGSDGGAYDHVEVFGALSEAAVDVDAEPGLRSAFHVHVGLYDLSHEDRYRALWQFIRWEPVLQEIAGARWSCQRPNMNTTVRDCTRYAFENSTGQSYSTRIIRDFDPEETTMSRLLDAQMESDRHSNLNVSMNRTPTWEFRLWNSTRSAWRMEMFAGLSVALIDPEMVTNLKSLSPADGIDSVALALSDAGHDRTAELVCRQAHYLDSRAGDAPSILTVL